MLLRNTLYFLAGVLLTFIIVVIYGIGIVEQECKDAGGVLAGSTCINPAAIIEVK